MSLLTTVETVSIAEAERDLQALLSEVKTDALQLWRVKSSNARKLTLRLKKVIPPASVSARKRKRNTRLGPANWETDVDTAAPVHTHMLPVKDPAEPSVVPPSTEPSTPHGEHEQEKTPEDVPVHSEPPAKRQRLDPEVQLAMPPWMKHAHRACRVTRKRPWWVLFTATPLSL